MSDSRTPLLLLLENYRPSDPHERAMWEWLCRFVRESPRCFDRGFAPGHVTASAWIVDAGRESALLTHHRKLGRWLQLGGHADGEAEVLQVALREASEESGLDDLRAVSSEIFDVDVHAIPARGREPEHHHFDVRFLLEADPGRPLRVSDESHDLRWLPLREIERWTKEESVLRMVRKTLGRVPGSSPPSRASQHVPAGPRGEPS